MEEDNLSDISSLEDLPVYFRVFSRDSLKAIRQRIEIANVRRKGSGFDDEDETPEPDPKLSQGEGLPLRLATAFDETIDSLAGVPLEDIDPAYINTPSYVIITKKKEIFRFSATDAMWLLSPFSPVRRVAVAILTHGLFSLTIITTILANCYVMIIPSSPITESSEVIFTAIYTFEGAVKMMARGFILEKFTYLRDAWNWLDFVVVSFAYVTMGIDLGNLSALRTCRVFRALKTVAIVPGLKTIVGAVIESVKNLRDVIILTIFALAVFGLVGLQIYMGVLTQKCIVDFPEDGSEGEERDRNWDLWNRNLTNWYPFPPPSEYGNANYPLCGNSSGAGKCPENHTCLQGYGPNPNYGYTSFDTFGSAFLSSFRLMTQDFWEGLYQQILRSAGPWHIVFFLVIIFLGSYYLVNLILAIVAMSYDELEKKADMDAMLEDQEREAMRKEEEARNAKLDAIAARSGQTGDPDKSPSKFSNKSYLGNLSGSGSDDPGKAPRITLQQPSLSSASLYGSFIKNDPFGSFSNIEDTKRDGSVGILLPFCLTRHQGPVVASDSVTDMLKSQQHAQSHPPTISVTPGSQLSQRRDSEKAGYLHVDREHPPTTDLPSTLKVPQERRDSIYSASEISGAPSEKDKKDVPLNELIDQASRRASMISQLDAARLRQAGQRPKLIEVIKAKVTAFSLKALDFFCLWDFGFPWNFFNQVVGFVVFDPFTELFITIAIVVNTVFMALDHYGLDEKPTFNAVLKTGNTVFTTIFTLECAMKLIAKSPKVFFQVGWNVFDFIIVAISLIEVMFEDANLPGLSALRSFRLLRVFKLAKSWPTLNMLLTIMGQTVGSLTNLVIVLVIIIFIFAVMGMQLFAKDYFEKYHKFPGGEMPRWNFTDFGHSFMIIFRVLCGEWIESMWDCMLVAGAACVPYFLATVLVGNLVLLNLFLALLLSSFGASNVAPSNGDDGSNKLAEAFNRIARFKRWIVNGLIKGFKALIALIIRAKNRIIPGKPEKVEEVKEVKKRRRPKLKRAATLIMNSQKLGKSIKSMKEGSAWEQPEVEGKTGNNDPDSPDSGQLRRRKEKKKNHCENQAEVDTTDNNESDTEWTEDSDDDDDDDDDEDDENKKTKDGEKEDEGPAQCMPDSFYERFPIFDVDDTVFGDAWNDIRLRMFKLIENKYFESAVIFLILLSSLALALEDVHLPNNPVLVDVLFYMDRVFTIIFFFEMLTKWMALGFVTYFTNAWCWLDFVIVMVSVINFVAGLFGAGNIQAFKTMRTLRALRPLRAMARMQGMRVVVNALIGAIPSISNVLMVCLIFWLIFAIMGVQLFSGKFQKCVDPADGSIPDFRIIRNKMECLANNYTWDNSVMNFDHVGKAYLCLFQVATFKGWIGIMNDAIDSREIDEQPHRETSFVMYGYFVIFIIVGSFFTLNLFIGVIIDNFNEQQKKSGGSMEMFMTEDQKKYYSAMQKMGSKKPIKSIPKPIWKPQLLVFNVVTNQKFDMIIMLLIGVNMLVMTMDHYNMTEEWDYWLNVINVIFVAIFTAECCLKIFALRHYYFKEPWNLFDVIVVFMSLVGMVLSDLIEKYFVSPTLLRVVRVAKVGRILRLVKGAKGIRTLLFALAMSLPALFNICLLLFLVMFIYSIFGMSFFMNVKLRGALDEVYNFQTFGQSIILLFQMSTSAGWDGVLDGIMDEDDCEAPNPEEGNPGDCGSTAAGIAFLLSYLVISFLIIINMYIAVILDNYSQATEEVQEGLTDDDYDMYYEVWEQFDPNATQYIPYSQLLDLVDILEPPLQIHKPNKIKVVSMDIAICKGDLVYCVDILDALTKDFFARKGNPVEETAEINEVQITKDRPGYEPISSTLFRQREEECARMIQRLWRRKRNEKKAMNQREGESGEK